jgi:hypothetical protein
MLLEKIKELDAKYLQEKMKTYNEELQITKDIFEKEVQTRSKIALLYAQFEDAKRKAAMDTYNLELELLQKSLKDKSKYVNNSTAALQRMLANENLVGKDREKIWQEVQQRIEAGNVGMWESFTAGSMDAAEQFGNTAQQMMDLGRKMTNSLADNLGNAFYEMISGVKNFKEAFRDMARAFADDVMRMISRMLAMQAVQASLGMAFSAFAPSTGAAIPAAANGAIFQGGFTPIKGFANGDVVRSPTLGMVGEGRFNEAIVPLPNGREIPVDMRGSDRSGGDIYQITINSIDPKSWDDFIRRNPEAIVGAISNSIRQRGKIFNDMRYAR